MENIENTNKEKIEPTIVEKTVEKVTEKTVKTDVKPVATSEIKTEVSVEIPTKVGLKTEPKIENNIENSPRSTPNNIPNRDFNKPKLVRQDGTPRSIVDPKDPNKVVFKDPARASNREYNRDNNKDNTKKPFFNRGNSTGGNSTGGFGNNRGGGTGGFGGGSSRFGGGFGNKPKFGSNGKRDFKKTPDKTELDMFAEVITVRRVTRVVKGGKRMRFAALVVVGDKKGLVGFANKKGMDYQDAVAKATKKAKENLIKINLTEDHSLSFSTVTKFKSARVLLKPAKAGTSLIAGGYVRPVLELVGIKNVYSKILGSNNKVVGVEAVINALKNYI